MAWLLTMALAGIGIWLDFSPWGWLAAVATAATVIWPAAWGLGSWRQAQATEARLAESRWNEERFRSVLENALEAVALIGSDGRINYVSPTVHDFLGFTPRELIGRSAFDLIHPEDRARSQSELQTLNAGPGVSVTAQTRFRHRDGTYRWIESRTVNLIDNPAVQALVSNFHDITVRRRTEATLKRSEERLRTLLGTIPDIVMAVDPEGVVKFINHPVPGLTREDVLEHPIYKFLPEDEQPRMQHYLRQVFATGLAGPFEARGLGPQGTDAWYACRAAPILDGERIVATVLVVTDITLVRGATAALRKSEARFRAFMDYNSAVAFIKDRDGKYVYGNAAWASQFGRPVDQLLNRTDDELWPPAAAALFRASDQYVLEMERGVEVEESVQMHDGRLRWFNVMKFPVPSEDGTTVVGGLAFDVTDRKLAVEALRQKEAELAHVSRLSTMGELVTGIAHEINQPLYAITNFAQACQNSLRSGDGDLDTIREWIDEIISAATRAGEIIRRLRAFLAKGETLSTRFSVGEIIRETVELLAFEARRRSVDVTIDIPAESLEVVADRIQIQQVLVNLLRNAFEALPGGRHDGRVSVEARRVPDAVEVSVRDNGQGLPEESRSNLFNAFVSTKPGGMGIGLAISRTIIEAHGGKLWAEANPGGGAVFFFRLPTTRRKRK